MSRGFEIYIEYSKRVRDVLENPLGLLAGIKNDILRYVQDAKVYLFGSVAQGKYTLSSDIDILVVSDRLEGIDKDAIKAYVKMRYIDYPIELHMISRREFERWYRRFIDESELIEI